VDEAEVAVAEPLESNTIDGDEVEVVDAEVDVEPRVLRP